MPLTLAFGKGVDFVGAVAAKRCAAMTLISNARVVGLVTCSKEQHCDRVNIQSDHRWLHHFYGALLCWFRLIKGIGRNQINRVSSKPTTVQLLVAGK